MPLPVFHRYSLRLSAAEPVLAALPEKTGTGSGTQRRRIIINSLYFSTRTGTALARYCARRQRTEANPFFDMAARLTVDLLYSTLT